jgi:hypothetical protein
MASLTLHLAKLSIFGGSGEELVRASQKIQGDQKVSLHLMITEKNTQKYVKQFQSLTMIT